MPILLLKNGRPDADLSSKGADGQDPLHDVMSLLSLVVVSIAIFILRYRTGCESMVGFIVALLGYGTAGYFWYYALSSVGQDRLSDLFGVANRLLAPGAIASGPVVCMPSSLPEKP